MKFRLSLEVWTRAWPIMLSNLSIPLLGIIDTAVVGHLPNADDIATVALGTMIFNVLFWCFGFLRMSTTALAAQEAQSNQIYYQSCTVGLMIALVLMCGSPLIKPIILSIIHTDSMIEKMVISYFDIRILSAIPTLINYVNYGFFFGRHNTKTPLYLLFFTNCFAMILDYILVWPFHLGANGVAFSNLITQSFSAALGTWLIYKNYLKPLRPSPKEPLFSLVRAKQLLALNTDIFIRTLCLLLTSAFFTQQSAYLGVQIVAANMILMNFQMVTSYALDGFAIAAEALVGRAVGRNDKNELLFQIKACAVWSGIFAFIFSTTYCILGPLFIAGMTSLAGVKAIALKSLPWVVILPLISAPGFLLDGVCIGATWSKPLRNAILFSSLVVFIPTWYFSKALANQGLWLAYSCFILTRGIYLATALNKQLIQE